jgi:hypothetical protein
MIEQKLVIEEETLICRKCLVDKPLTKEYFATRVIAQKQRKWCKLCEYQYTADYYKRNPNIRAKYDKKYYHSHKPNIKKIHKQFNIRNKERQRAYNTQYYKNNKPTLQEYHRKYRNNKMKTNPYFRFVKHLRIRIHSGIREGRGIKTCKSTELLGCSFMDARKHIESQFTAGMTWDNNTQLGWHIDHIKPISSFDLTKLEEQKKCFHYTNLQPLWWIDNLSKGCKFI